MNSTLEGLDLSGNRIGDSGCTALARALEANSTLEALLLSNNQIGDEGGRVLAAALRRNASLRHVDVYTMRREIKDTIEEAVKHVPEPLIKSAAKR
jgi:Ran GTPase-activating protein (RanGAP) involved in mRNA processing and transport